MRFCWLLLLCLLYGCGKAPLYQEQAFVFGTSVEVSVYGVPETKAREAVAAVLQELQRLHNQYHAWQPSELSELNTAFAQGQRKTVSPELGSMLREATQLSQQSQGLFNPAIGGLIQLWGFQADEYQAKLPDTKQIQLWLQQQPRMTDIVIEQNVVYSQNPAVRLDFGGYAKGYALDRAAALLRKQGVQHALLNIGGNIMALGQHGDRAWRVGVQHPRKAGPLATLELRDGEAIGTSGDYQRYFMLDNVRYCHLLDPRSGQPVRGVQAVTVLTRGEHAGVLSDVVSKPIFLSGKDAWRDAAQRMNVKQVLMVDGAGEVYVTADLQPRLTWADEKNKKHILP